MALPKPLGPDARDDTVFGTFSTPAKLAIEVGRKHMVKSTHTPDGNHYWLDPIVKALLEQIQGTTEAGTPMLGGNGDGIG